MPSAPLPDPTAHTSQAESSDQSTPVTSSATPAAAEPAANRQQLIVTWVLLVAGAAALTYFKPQLAHTIFIFVVTLSVLVFVHEWGHYQFARWAGMKVNRFGIGFPPWILNVRRNNIDYSIGALPIGGMVDIAGLGSEEEMVATVKGAELTVDRPHPETPHGEKQFQDASLGWRFWTLFAGPLMNFVYAIVVFISIYCFVGLPNPLRSNLIEAVKPNTPAVQAGIRPGDRLVGVDELRTPDPDKLGKAIRGSNGKPVAVAIERNGQIITKTITPAFSELEGLGRVPTLGIQFEEKIISISWKKTDFGTAVKSGFIQSAGISLSILNMLKRAITRNLSKEEAEGVGGPVKIAQVVGESARMGGLSTLLLMSAMLSVNLGLLNLLPFPALDGGRILFLGYELIARRPLDPRKESFVHMVGMVMLLAFILFITMRDISSLIG